MDYEDDDRSWEDEKDQSHSARRVQPGNVDLSAGMDSVIQVMNQLYDVGHQLNLQQCNSIKLPQIAVCGSQSSGKTSVLESISGEEFLPRGVDIQTRCPIVLELNNVKGTEKYVEFRHLPGKRFFDMDDVKLEIGAINQQIIESGQVVSAQPITIKLYSPNVPNLTLVDLPGLVENHVEGQSPTVVQEISQLVRNYITNPNCIILAISPANTDIAGSKSIRLSREVDPEGRRTLGVLTKLDMMDKGTNATDVLSGKKIQLDLGFIGVVNRCFLEVQEGASFQDQLEKERHFLQTHYPTLAHVHGTSHLVKRVSELLMQTIKDTLPAIQHGIEQEIDKYQQILDEIGGTSSKLEEPKPKGVLLLELLTQFVEAFTAQVDGRRRNLELGSVNASAKINQVFDLFLGQEFDKVVASKLTDVEIDHAIVNSSALHSRHIDYDDAFQELAKREIQNLHPFVKQCAREVNKEMRNAVYASCDSSIKMHPKLYKKIKHHAHELINERFEDCNKYLQDYLDAECSIARTIRGDFRDHVYSKGGEFTYAYANGSLTEASAEAIEVTEETISNSHDRKIHRAIVRKDINLYFNQAKMQIMEHVARGIVFKLVYGTSNVMSRYMLLHLHTSPNAQHLLSDEEIVNDIEERRKQAHELLRTCEKANEVVDVLLRKKF